MSRASYDDESKRDRDGGEPVEVFDSWESAFHESKKHPDKTKGRVDSKIDPAFLVLSKLPEAIQ